MARICCGKIQISDQAADGALERNFNGKANCGINCVLAWMDKLFWHRARLPKMYRPGSLDTSSITHVLLENVAKATHKSQKFAQTWCATGYGYCLRHIEQKLLAKREN